MKKCVISISSFLAGVAAGALGARKIIGERSEQNQKISDKYMSLFIMMNQWVKVKQEGKNLASYFEQRGYWEIAVYGMSHAGRTFINELKDSSVKIRYGIDQRPGIAYERLDIISPEDELEMVDAIVVTPVTYFTEIEEHLNRKINCPIISLEDILYEL